jgi:plasmid maintenance system killer protein
MFLSFDFQCLYTTRYEALQPRRGGYCSIEVQMVWRVLELSRKRKGFEADINGWLGEKGRRG